ncbi:hypothetical protein [Bacillus sp. X1(2014)]|uniref:hypothetical protein n=1 Tax=Bacillus sp. X1(2014) TaxID=1565991 RepID=UPI001C93176E|nr:hypothetical protein [Bacillus sp. X1(2014)]
MAFIIGSVEDSRGDFLLTLPYVYEIDYEKLSLFSFLEEFMEFGDVVEIYEY